MKGVELRWKKIIDIVRGNLAQGTDPKHESNYGLLHFEAWVVRWWGHPFLKKNFVYSPFKTFDLATLSTEDRSTWSVLDTLKTHLSTWMKELIILHKSELKYGT